MNDYKDRKYLDITVEMLHSLVKAKKIKYIAAVSGQKRFDLQELKNYESNLPKPERDKKKIEIHINNVLNINDTTQKIFVKNAMSMDESGDNSIHLLKFFS